MQKLLLLKQTWKKQQQMTMVDLSWCQLTQTLNTVKVLYPSNIHINSFCFHLSHNRMQMHVRFRLVFTPYVFSLYIIFDACLKILKNISKHIYVIMLCILICQSMLFHVNIRSFYFAFFCLFTSKIIYHLCTYIVFAYATQYFVEYTVQLQCHLVFIQLILPFLAKIVYLCICILAYY